MKKILIAAAATLALAGCGSSNTATSAGGTSSDSSSDTSMAPANSAPTAGLSATATSLGTIVVDTAGRTIYRYDADKQGATNSACTGGCASAWPAVPAGTVASRITGKVGSITGVDGKPQATLDGWPLYYYAEDSAPGDATGQGVGGTWWVVTPAGAEITAAPSASSPAGQSGGYGY